MNLLFQLPFHEVRNAVLPLLETDERSPERIASIFARGVWTRLVEPGDGIAGWMISALGPITALAMVIERRSAEAIRERCMSQDSSDAAPAVSALDEALARWQQRLHSRNSLTDFATAQRKGIRLLVPEGEHWPQTLNDLGIHTPLALWARGDHAALVGTPLAVVGSRAATGYGEHVTAELVAATTRRGVTIVSGGAYGIDGVAHRTALAVEGRTVVVMAGGVDRLYPAGHEALFDRVAATGLLCAEQAPGTAPTKWRFLQRNRIIAALSSATLVCEAGHRSGSLNTAGHAAQLGRPLGAVPGPVTSAASAGCHRLLREYDAACIRHVDDVLELLGHDSRESGGQTLPGESHSQRRVLDALSFRRAQTAQLLSQASGVSLREVREALAEYELLGMAKENEAGWKRLHT